MLDTSTSSRVAVVGGGLVGSLLSLFLSRRGVEVELFERRPDPRTHDTDRGRSINLALSVRGIHALQQVGLDQEILAESIPMRGRFIHPLEGRSHLVPYSKKESEVIYSVSRLRLNQLLLDAVARENSIRTHFGSRCVGVDLRGAAISLEGEDRLVERRGFDALFGTDGAGSVLRSAMLPLPLFNYSQDYLGHGYKELTIPPRPDGMHRIEANALHIWPRGSYMMIALPNTDGSFTCTLFLPHKGKVSFESLQDAQSVRTFFSQVFPDTHSLIPSLEEEFFENPMGTLSTVKCSPWHQGQALLLGDAAHAIVPFYGQGMNCGFEDCVLLDECITQYGLEWQKVFSSFSSSRKPDADAIGELALDNFIEMRDTSGDPKFQMKRAVEHLLEERYPEEFVSKYSMVTFRRIPYSRALALGRLQDEIIMSACREAEGIAEIDLSSLYFEIKDSVRKLCLDQRHER